MFSIDPNITDLKDREKSLCKVFFSMNTHEVATPEMSVEEARTFVLFFREGSGTASAYIGLYFVNSDRKLYYTHSPSPFPSTDMADVETEARNFAEDLGALLDEIDIDKMSAEEKKHWIQENGLFSVKIKVEEQPVPAPLQGKISPPSSGNESISVQIDLPQVKPFAEEPESAAAVIQPLAKPAVSSQIAGPRIQNPVAPAPVQHQGAVFPDPPNQPTGKAAAPMQKQPGAADTQGMPSAGSRVRVETPDTSAVPVHSQTPAFDRADDLLEEAVRTGVVKAPKRQLKREIQNTAGVVTRDREALARLFSSF